MIKKLFILIVCLLCFVSNSSAQSSQPVDLEVEKIDPTTGDDPHKSPVVVPELSLNDHQFFFHGTHSDYSLVLQNEDGYVVYTTYVSSSVSSVVLPSTLSGEFEIRLIPDDSNYYFYGYIEL